MNLIEIINNFKVTHKWLFSHVRKTINRIVFNKTTNKTSDFI